MDQDFQRICADLEKITAEDIHNLKLSPVILAPGEEPPPTIQEYMAYVCDILSFLNDESDEGREEGPLGASTSTSTEAESMR